VSVRPAASSVAPPAGPGVAALQPADLLSAVLSELRFASAAYRWLELGSPFRVSFEHPGLRGVHLIARGECDLVLGDGTVDRLTAGDLVILPRGDPHLLCSPGTPAASVVAGVELATRSPGVRLRAGGPAVDTVIMCGAFVVGVPDHPALRGLPRSIRLRGAGGRPAPWLASLAEALRAEASDPGPGSDLVLARLSDALLVRALRLYGDTVEHPGWLAGLRDPCVAAALAAVHARPADPWTVASLAKVAGLSRSAFAARFHDRVGEPAMRYLLSLRMQRAKALLRDGETVAAVATRVGYRSEQAFAAAFKREAGTAPGAYRTRPAGER
jgi:AraC-like DNA-binding protein